MNMLDEFWLCERARLTCPHAGLGPGEDHGRGAAYAIEEGVPPDDSLVPEPEDDALAH